MPTCTHAQLNDKDQIGNGRVVVVSSKVSCLI